MNNSLYKVDVLVVNHSNLPQASLEKRVIYSKNISVFCIHETSVENLNHGNLQQCLRNKLNEEFIPQDCLSLGLCFGTCVSVCVICHLCFSLNANFSCFCLYINFIFFKCILSSTTWLENGHWQQPSYTSCSFLHTHTHTFTHKYSHYAHMCTSVCTLTDYFHSVLIWRIQVKDFNWCGFISWHPLVQGFIFCDNRQTHNNYMGVSYHRDNF